MQDLCYSEGCFSLENPFGKKRSCISQFSALAWQELRQLARLRYRRVRRENRIRCELRPISGTFPAQLLDRETLQLFDHFRLSNKYVIGSLAT